MKSIKKYLIGTSYTLLSIIILSLIVTIFSYFNLFNYGLLKWLKIFIPIISIFIGGLYIGKYSLKKGYLEGIKLALIYIFISLIFSLIFKSFKFNILIYYVVLIFASMGGAMIGINKKEDNN